MRKNWVAIAAAVVGLSWSAGARAEEGSSFGGQGSVSLAAERLFGIHHASPSTGSNFTSFSLFGSGGVEASTAPYSIPRIGLDYFAAGGSASAWGPSSPSSPPRTGATPPSSG